MTLNLPDLPGAVCSGVDAELWFPDHTRGGGERERQAKAICLTCPAREACLSYALAEPMAGIWGGLTEAERHLLSGRPATTDPTARARSVAARLKRQQRAENAIIAARLRDSGLGTDVIAVRMGVSRKTVTRYLEAAS